MSDEDDAFFTPPVAAIPSRAAPRFDLEKQVEKLGPDSLLPPKSERLPPAEIDRITRNRRKNLKKRTRGRPTKIKAVEKKSPNRPLQLKTQLHTVLQIVAALNRVESVRFTNVMQVLEDMPATSRKRVIAALARVYA